MFISNTPEDKKQMLEKIGVSSLPDLFKDIPQDLLYPALNLPPALTEGALTAHMHALAAKNKPLLNFAGAGCEEHFIPAAVNALSSRGEFLTAYTPYQAEASQGTLQTIYEFQSCICELFDMDVCSASHYDGATALAEACAAAQRVNNKSKILYSAGLHPHYKEVLKTYLKHTPGLKLEEVPLKNGTLDLSALQEKLTPDTACFAVAGPNFFGQLEPLEDIAALTHGAGALLVSVAKPLALALVHTPGQYGADFSVAEGQVLGNAMNFGGPGLGIFTCKKEYVRQVPGRIVGIAKDKDGRRSFVLTLQAREQHIRRERAASNICSNQALCALSAVIYLTLLGYAGLREVAELNLEKAHRLKDMLLSDGHKLKFDGPFFNEFVLELNAPAKQVIKKLAKKGIAAGFDLGLVSKELKNCLLVCATETKTEADLQKYVDAMRGF